MVCTDSKISSIACALALIQTSSTSTVGDVLDKILCVENTTKLRAEQELNKQYFKHDEYANHIFMDFCKFIKEMQPRITLLLEIANRCRIYDILESSQVIWNNNHTEEICFVCTDLKNWSTILYDDTASNLLRNNVITGIVVGKYIKEQKTDLILMKDKMQYKNHPIEMMQYIMQNFETFEINTYEKFKEKLKPL